MQSIKNLIKGENILWLILTVIVVDILVAIYSVAVDNRSGSNAYEIGRELGLTARPVIVILGVLALIYITIRIIRINKK